MVTHENLFRFLLLNRSGPRAVRAQARL